jgi:hypothetical protein
VTIGWSEAGVTVELVGGDRSTEPASMPDVLESTIADDVEPPALVELGLTWLEDSELWSAEDLELISGEELEATGPASAPDEPLGRVCAEFAGVESVRGAGSGAGPLRTGELWGAGSGPGPDAARAGDTVVPNAPATNRTAATSPILACRRLTIALRTTCAAPGRPRDD